jgi:(4S)-4-hydroxy-5-phosphonooxypentane-2,3-dione isomerase
MKLTGGEMYIVHVQINVKPDFIDAFRVASLENAQNSIKEPGIVRFDLLQEVEDPTRFVLVEVYRTEKDAGLHKETAHYGLWRDTVAEMMAEPRRGTKYMNHFPDDAAW